MDLLKCRVCDSQGSYTQLGMSIPKINDNYTFYAAVNANVPAGGQPELPLEVKVTMPVGGKMGLFRFPRIGEWVLIGQVGQTGYEDVDINGEKQATHVTAPTGEWVLLSYFPQAEEGDDDKNTPFYPKRAKKTVDNNKTGFFADQLNPATMEEFLNDNGMAIRYLAEKNKNKNKDATNTVNDGAWSEIGFYNKKAKWPNKLKTFDKKDEGKSLDPSLFNRQDVINIRSAGDIESRAENYHLIKAKRFELLANAEELSPEIRAHNDRDAWSGWKPEYAALGDHPADDPAIHNGDVHIRAGKRVVIKADSEIRLQVGRTVLVIKDSGFSVTVRKVNSNVGISQDTSLSLKARGGIDMRGENVNIASSRKFSITDAWGGGLASMAGMANLSGIQINQKTYDRGQQVVAALMNNLTLAQDITVGSLAIGNPEQVYAAGWVNHICKFGKILFNAIRNYILWGEDYNKAYSKEYWDEARSDIINSMQAELDKPDVPEDQKQQTRMKKAAFEADEKTTDTDAAGTALNLAVALIDAEPIERVMVTLDMILNLSDTVCTVIEILRTLKMDPIAKRNFADKLNLAAMSVDNGFVIAALDLVAGYNGAGGPASIRLRDSGDIIIKAGTQKNLYAEASTKVSLPTIWSEKVRRWLKFVAIATKLTADSGNLAVQVLNTQKAIPSNLEEL